MKIAIFSSEKKIDSTIRRAASEYSLRKMMTLEIKTFSELNSFLNSVYEFDLIFVDDGFEGRTTIETSRIIRARHPSGAVVVISDDTEKVYDAFLVKAFRFLVKPVEESSITECLEAYRRENYSYKMVVAKVNGVFRTFSTEEIIYIEADGKITIIYCDSSGITTTTPYIQISQQLPEEYFIMPHRSFAVNMMHIREFDQNQITLDNNVTIPLSRRRKMDFYIKFNEFTRSHNFLN